MNNNSNEFEEEQCEICSIYDLFVDLLENDVDVKESFHTAFEYFIEESVEPVLDILVDNAGIQFERGYSQGYINSMQTISEQLATTAEILEEDLEDLSSGCMCDQEDNDIANFDETDNDDDIDDSDVKLADEKFAKWLREQMK